MWNGSLILGKTTILFLVKFADLIVCEYEREWRIEIHAAIYCDRYELCSLQCPCGESCLEGGGGYLLISQSFDEFHGCGRDGS